MLYLAYKDENEEAQALICDYEELHSVLFSPAREALCIIDLDRIHGKTYTEKQSFLRDKAIDFQNTDSEISGGGLSWGEYAAIGDFFEKYGKRYGLLREFRENAIC